MATQSIQCGAIQARLVRSRKRKSLGIYVKDAEVTVRASLNEPLANIHAFVTAKAEWIEQHLHHQKTTQAQSDHHFCNGDVFLYLNRPHQLKLQVGKPTRVELQGDTMFLTHSDIANKAAVKKVLEQWYKKQALSYLTERVNVFSQRLQLYPKAVSVRRYKSRWGSCNHRGELQFNWLIMMAPTEVIDYLVVHELCHLKFFDHSPSFWRLVKTFWPQYAIQKQWLKQQTQLAWPNNE